MCLEHDWSESYRSSQGPPWDIGRPQPVFIKLVENREMTPPGPVLDVGCGTGENAIFYAQNKFTTSGVDFTKESISQAKAKAKARKATVDFRLANALDMKFPALSFQYVTDCGLFHGFDDSQRLVFRDEVARVLKIDGTYLMACISDKEPTDWGGPRRVSKQEIETVFSPKLRINYIRDDYLTTKIHANGGKAYLTSATKRSL